MRHRLLMDVIHNAPRAAVSVNLTLQRPGGLGRWSCPDRARAPGRVRRDAGQRENRGRVRRGVVERELPARGALHEEHLRAAALRGRRRREDGVRREPAAACLWCGRAGLDGPRIRTWPMRLCYASLSSAFLSSVLGRSRTREV